MLVSAVCMGAQPDGLWCVNSVERNQELSRKREIEHGTLEVFYKKRPDGYWRNCRLKVYNHIQYNPIETLSIVNNVDGLLKGIDATAHSRMRPLEDSDHVFYSDLNLSLSEYAFRPNMDVKEKTVLLTDIVLLNETESMLNLKEYRIQLHSDRVCFVKKDHCEKISIYNPERVEQIRKLCEEDQAPFIVQFKKGGEKYKILRYTNASYLWWNYWIPRFHLECVGIRMKLKNIQDPQELVIDTSEDQKALPAYNRNKKIGYCLTAISTIVSVIAVLYCLKDAIGSVLWEELK